MLKHLMRISRLACYLISFPKNVMRSRIDLIGPSCIRLRASRVSLACGQAVKQLVKSLFVVYKICIEQGQAFFLLPFSINHNNMGNKLRKGGRRNSISSDDSDILPPEEANYTATARRKSVFAEAYNPEEDEEDEKTVVHPKSDAQRRSLLEAVKGILLFRSLEQEQLGEVLDAMFYRQVEPGDNIIQQGDDGDNFYVIDR